MKKQNKQSPVDPPKVTHPGSSLEDAKAVGGKGDFGVPEGNVVERTYTSRNTKRSDPNAVPARSGSDESRTSGAGGSNSGLGSSSGGDIDMDITLEPATTPTESEEHRPGHSETIPRIHGSVAQQPDAQSLEPQGADAVSRSDGDDDSFVGEVSSDEATGRNDAGD